MLSPQSTAFTVRAASEAIKGIRGGAVSVINPPSTTIVSSDKGICHEKPLHFFLERYAGAYIEEIKAFYDAIINNKETPVKAIDGLKAVELGIAALKSAQENRPVKIEEIK